MLWLLLLHISALLCWCGTLLYLPALIARASVPPSDLAEMQHPRLIRHLFTLAATPAALIAIGSGTLLFVVEGILEVWLIAKLTLVIGLVAGHVLTGWMVLRHERTPGSAAAYSLMLGVTMVAIIAAILWLVLAKPALGV